MGHSLLFLQKRLEMELKEKIAKLWTELEKLNDEVFNLVSGNQEIKKEVMNFKKILESKKELFLTRPSPLDILLLETTIEALKNTISWTKNGEYGKWNKKQLKN